MRGLSRRRLKSYVAMEKPHSKIAKSAILEWDASAVPGHSLALFSSFRGSISTACQTAQLRGR